LEHASRRTPSGSLTEAGTALVAASAGRARDAFWTEVKLFKLGRVVEAVDISKIYHESSS
jgi:hypothetical protein